MACIESVTKNTRCSDNKVVFMNIKPDSVIFDFKSKSGKIVLTSTE